MSTCRIVKALELIHQAKACADKSWSDLVACLDHAEDELLDLKAELAKERKQISIDDIIARLKSDIEVVG